MAWHTQRPPASTTPWKQCRCSPLKSRPFAAAADRRRPTAAALWPCSQPPFSIFGTPRSRHFSPCSAAAPRHQLRGAKAFGCQYYGSRPCATTWRPDICVKLWRPPAPALQRYAPWTLAMLQASYGAHRPLPHRPLQHPAASRGSKGLQASYGAHRPLPHPAAQRGCKGHTAEDVSMRQTCPRSNRTSKNSECVSPSSNFPANSFLGVAPAPGSQCTCAARVGVCSHSLQEACRWGW